MLTTAPHNIEHELRALLILISRAFTAAFMTSDVSSEPATKNAIL